MPLLLTDAQQRIHTALQPEGYWPIDTICLRLAEETGEICKARRKESFERVRSEVGDALFTLICLANALGIDLDVLVAEKCDDARSQMAATNVDPLTGRLRTGE